MAINNDDYTEPFGVSNFGFSNVGIGAENTRIAGYSFIWSGTLKYSKGVVVTYDGSLYQSVEEIPAPAFGSQNETPLIDTLRWLLIGGGSSQEGLIVDWKHDSAEPYEYTKNSLVSYDGQIYVAIEDNLGIEAADNPKINLDSWKGIGYRSYFSDNVILPYVDVAGQSDLWVAWDSEIATYNETHEYGQLTDFGNYHKDLVPNTTDSFKLVYNGTESIKVSKITYHFKGSIQSLEFAINNRAKGGGALLNQSKSDYGMVIKTLQPSVTINPGDWITFELRCAENQIPEGLIFKYIRLHTIGTELANKREIYYHKHINISEYSEHNSVWIADNVLPGDKEYNWNWRELNKTQELQLPPEWKYIDVEQEMLLNPLDVVNFGIDLTEFTTFRLMLDGIIYNDWDWDDKSLGIIKILTYPISGNTTLTMGYK